MPRSETDLPGSRRHYVRLPMPEVLEFQHARLVEAPPSGSAWLHEVKLDGYRLQLRVERGSARIHTRNAHDWTERFPELVEAACALPDCILDGELCALDVQGQPDFSTLRASITPGRTAGLVLFIFDVLWREGEDLRPYALQSRKAVLEAVLADHASPRLRPVGPLPGHGAALLKAACEMGFEGIVSKRKDAAYAGGRTDTWVKAKCRPGQEVVIGGWKTDGSKFRSLIVGVWEQDNLRYGGRVHTGFSDAKLRELLPKLKALESPASPFSLGDPPRKTSDIHWVRPELVANVDLAEWTPSGKVRQASYKGLREDKTAAEVVREIPAPAVAPPAAPSVKAAKRAPSRSPAIPEAKAISHPGKALWPATETHAPITKGDLAAYFAEVADWILPYIRGRPCTVLLAPDGIGGELFFQRHEGQRVGGLRDSKAVTHVEAPALGHVFPQLDTPEALQAAVQSDAIEIHPWNNVPGDLSLPGRFLFDLDPDEGLPFDKVVEAARELRDRLSAIGLVAWLKTSGGKGLHLVTPFRQESASPISWTEAKVFAKRVCEEMAADSPDRYTIALPKAARKGRVFLDYLRTDQTRHAAALLSPRATPEATVSMPLSWMEARPGLDPKAFTVLNAVDRLRRDPVWRDYDEGDAPPLRRAMERLGR